MAVVLNPATLKFSDAELEAAYALYRTTGALMTAEFQFLRLNGIMYFLFVVSEVVSPNSTFTTSLYLKLLGVAVTIVQCLLLRYLTTETWVRYRTLLIGIFRTARLLVFLWSVPYWISDPSIDARTLFKTAVFRTGLLLNVWFALGMPLLFAEHVLLHGVNVVLTALMTTPSACTAILDTPTSRHLFMGVWRHVHEVLVMLAGIREYGSSTEYDSTMYDRIPYSCEMLLIVAHGVVAFVLPTLLLWKMEVSSRQSYINDVNRMGHTRRIYLDCSWLPDVGRILVFSAVSTSACWVLIVNV